VIVSSLSLLSFHLLFVFLFHPSSAPYTMHITMSSLISI
jgi:hypothetical protein